MYGEKYAFALSQSEAIPITVLTQHHSLSVIHPREFFFVKMVLTFYEGVNISHKTLDSHKHMYY